ncbi:MAG: hypothetical protein IJS46_01315, partial [Kiritimatiellae bacterium]|nr:hypothetical protein [Kiritimatiellia bacterium]
KWEQKRGKRGDECRAGNKVGCVHDFSLRVWCRSRSDTKEVKTKASLRIPKEALRFALIETRREASAYAPSLQGVAYREISQVSFDDRFAAIWLSWWWCYVILVPFRAG